MPTYDYRCNTCGKEFEHFQSMKDDALTNCLCEKAGSVTRLISKGSGIIFKGSGFYVTDYKKPDAGAPSTQSSSSAVAGSSTASSSSSSDSGTSSSSQATSSANSGSKTSTSE